MSDPWRDTLLVLSTLLSAITAWLRLHDWWDARRRARRIAEQVRHNPADPFGQIPTQDPPRPDDQTHDGDGDGDGEGDGEDPPEPRRER